jgi:hypothetical protein
MNKPFLSLRDSTQIVVTTLMSVSLPFLATDSAHAAGSNMPWEQPLQQVCLSQLQGGGEYGDAKRCDRFGTARHHLCSGQPWMGQD